MIKMKIASYTQEDNEYALALEEQCIQGKSLKLRFYRPTFQARSEVYDNYTLLCAKENETLIGIVAGTIKQVNLHHQKIQALYIYDLRVHPDYRGLGVAKRLCNTLIRDIGSQVECIYSLINAQNNRALELACRNFNPEVIIPLTYIILPVYKKYSEENHYRYSSASHIHEMYLQVNKSIEFRPEFNEEKLLGLVNSVSCDQENKGGCSIWTNENLLAEQVVGIPYSFRIMKALAKALHQFIKLPPLPELNEIIPSWFLFDLWAENAPSLRNILAVANNIALSRRRKFLYILLNNNDPLLTWIKKTGYKVYTFPYVFLAKGQIFPEKTERIYIDVMDL